MMLQYIRYEELQTALNPEIENALSNLHTGLAHQCPSLLPVLSQLSASVNSDVARHIQQKAALKATATATAHGGAAGFVVTQQQLRQNGNSNNNNNHNTNCNSKSISTSSSSRDPYIENIRNRGNTPHGFPGTGTGGGGTGGGGGSRSTMSYASYATRYR